MSRHSKVGASGAKTWASCTASVGLIEQNAHRVSDQGSLYAMAGSHAHEFAKNLLSGLIALEDVPEHDEEGKELRVPIALYVSTCKALIGKHATVYVEREVPLYYKPEDVGTVDFISVTDEEIHVRDYKHGEGVLVDSQDNLQMAIYAMSAIHDLEDSGMYNFSPAALVTLQAIQPRHREWQDEPWKTTVGELRQFCAVEITPSARTILEGGEVVFAPSDEACRWCKAKAFCTARAQWLDALPSSINPLDHFTDLTAPRAETLTDEQLLSCYVNADPVIKFLKDVEEYLLERALSGKPLDGTKLVQGREGNRAWVDEKEAGMKLAKYLPMFDDRFKTTMHSPAQIEKKLEAKGEDTTILESLTSRSPGKSVLALESDKRPAINTVEMFSDLDT